MLGVGRLGEGLTAVVFAVVADHEHHLPLEDIGVVDQAAGYAWDVFACLHLLKLALEEGRGRC
jgi:hypothetical protein